LPCKRLKKRSPRSKSPSSLPSARPSLEPMRVTAVTTEIAPREGGLTLAPPPRCAPTCAARPRPSAHRLHDEDDVGTNRSARPQLGIVLLLPLADRHEVAFEACRRGFLRCDIAFGRVCRCISRPPACTRDLAPPQTKADAIAAHSAAPLAMLAWAEGLWLVATGCACNATTEWAQPAPQRGSRIGANCHKQGARPFH
jgi:hypothetical protein